MAKKTILQKASFVRNFIFGVEDSLVSTVGMLSGIAVADVPRATIFLSGMVLIVVEALSMGVGSLLSETATEEFIYKKERVQPRSYVGGVIMFLSYFVAGFIPLTPYYFLAVQTAFPISIAASLISLFFLGFLGAKYFGANIWRSGLRMFIFGGLAISAGMAIGSLLS